MSAVTSITRPASIVPATLSPAENSGLTNIQQALRHLTDYCRAHNWSGYDPYDGLNSRLFNSTPLANYRWPRLALTQALKRIPVNMRPLLGVPKEANPKGLALFTSSLIRLSRIGLASEDEVQTMANSLLNTRSPGQERYCWGYNFAWQTRTYLVPKGTPNIICTTFAGNALLDAYDASGDGSLLEAAISAGHFLLEGLNRTGDGASFCFSYTPLDRSEIHNANLLGAAFLARLLALKPNLPFEPLIRASTRFSIERQRPDGSWPYGESSKQRWIDSFHTGYNLVALQRIRDSLSDRSLDQCIRSGFDFFRDHFFTSDGCAKYFHNRTYPVDSHSVAQAILTLLAFRDLNPGNVELACSVGNWSVRHMWSGNGYFYFQKHPLFTNKIPYMRWVQAWMLLALSTLVEFSQNKPASSNVLS